MLKVRRRGNTVRVAADQVQEHIHGSKKGAEDIETEAEASTLQKFISLFLSSTISDRQKMLLKILKECDSHDIKYLNSQIPRLHRDFLSIPDKKIVYRILEYVHPKDLVMISKVTKSWFELMTCETTWFALYESLGLQSMVGVFYIPNGTPLQNAKRYHSYGNWAHGHFCYREFQAHSLGILCMAFDGKFIATGSSDRTCKVFQVRTGYCVRILTGHDEAVQAIQFDDEKIVSGSADKTIKVWSNKDSGSLLQTLPNHTGPITCLRLQGYTLVSGSQDKTIRIWNLSDYFAKATHIEQLSMPTNSRRRAQVMPKTYASPCLRTLHGHDSAVKSIELHRDIILSGDIHGFVRIWHLPRYSVLTSGNCIGVLGLSSISQSIIRLPLNNPTDSTLYSSTVHEPIVSIQFNEKRMQLATLSGYTFLVQVNPLPTSSESLHKGYMNHFLWAQDESNWNSNQYFRFEDTNTPEAKREMGMQGQWVLFSKTDDWRLMSGGSQGYVVVWNHKIGKYLYKLRVLSDTGTNDLGVARKGDGFGSMHGLTHRVGSLASFAKKDATADTRALTALAFDDSYIIAAGMNGSIFLWEPNM